MQALDKIYNKIEHGIAHQSTELMQELVRDLQSMRHLGVSMQEINQGLTALNNKLHHDGLLPGLNIVGFENGDKGSLLVNAKGTHDVFALGKHPKETQHADLRRSETNLPTDVHHPSAHHEPNRLTNSEQRFASAMETFRGDRYHRAHLRNENPALYMACKLEDQKEVDAVFGPGKKLRDFNGAIVDNTAAQRQRIRDLEQLYKYAPPARPIDETPTKTIARPDEI